jgi:hypothetical protein
MAAPMKNSAPMIILSWTADAQGMEQKSADGTRQ